MIVPVLCGVGALAVWGGVVAARWAKVSRGTARSGANEQALADFVVRSLALPGLSQVLAEAAATGQAAFGATSAAIFEPGAKEGLWDVWAPGPRPLDPVGESSRAVFGWLRHNAEVIVLGEVAGPRFGAMRIPLGELSQRYGVDVLLPLVDRQQVIAILGLSLGRKPTPLERRLLEDLRVEVTAAAANVRLHREAAHKLTLEKEVDLAGAVAQALAPLRAEASQGRWSWVGHVRSAGQVGGDFWCSYEVEGGVLVVVGDVIGGGLGGSMISAAVKSSCDAFAAAGVVDPATLLAGVNRAVWRPGKQFHVTAVALYFDEASGEVAWANAGHPAPYVTAAGDERPGALLGWGAMLGESEGSEYVTQRRSLASGDTVLMHTDGVPEAMNPERVAFGERRLQRALAAVRDQSLPRARDQILYAIEAWKNGVPATDDELFVLVRAK